MRLPGLLAVILGAILTIGIYCAAPMNAATPQPTGNRVQLEQRLRQLKAEYAAGKKELAELQAREAAVQDRLKRIEGAIQTIQAELAKSENSSGK